MNHVHLMGRITRELEVKYSASGSPYLNFSAAVQRPFKNKQGERETDFINVTAFNKQAETIGQYFNKGESIIVHGRIETGSYVNKEGQTVYTTEVILSGFDFPIQNKNQSQGNTTQANPQSNAPQKQRAQQPKKDDNPFANVDFDAEDPFANNEDVTSIDDSDLPF